MSFFARFFLGVVAVMILALCFSSFISQQSEFERLLRDRQKLERQRDQLYQRYETLKGLDAMAESDAYLERIARDYLSMARPGEILIITD